MRFYQALLILPAAVILFSAGCSRQPDARSDEFVIRGKYGNCANKEVMIESVGPTGIIPLDTTTTDADGNFYFRRPCSGMLVLRVKNEMNNFLMVIVSPGETASITADAEDIRDTYTVSGSRESELVLEFENILREAHTHLDSLRNAWDDVVATGDPTGQRPLFDSVAEDIFSGLHGGMERFIEARRGTMASLFAVYQDFERRNIFSYEEDFKWYEYVLSGLEESMPDNPFTTDMRDRIENIRKDLLKKGILAEAGTDSIPGEDAQGKTPGNLSN